MSTAIEHSHCAHDGAWWGTSHSSGASPSNSSTSSRPDIDMPVRSCLMSLAVHCSTMASSVVAASIVVASVSDGCSAFGGSSAASADGCPASASGGCSASSADGRSVSNADGCHASAFQ